MNVTRLAFTLPRELEAGGPPESRGLARDGVRMLVAYRSTRALIHSTFSLIPTFLQPGDLVVVNTSGTIPAAVDAVALDQAPVVVHFSTWIAGNIWVVEPRRPKGKTSVRWSGGNPPRTLLFGDGAVAELLEPYMDSKRLWVARVEFPEPALGWLAEFGRPIRYNYVEQPWPIEAYQTVYAVEPGSDAEMPSAGRPFTPEVITRLVANGIGVTPVVLHSGVASLEADEMPYPERVKVPPWTADRVNATHRAGGRVIAVGTTVVRALEAATDAGGQVSALDGWTALVVTPGVRTIDGLLTGWHEPEASHLLLLEAIAGRELLEDSYAASLSERYLWHEFGDVHLILP